MTEEEWLNCADDAKPMWVHIHYACSRRESILVQVACIRRIWHLLTDPRARRAVEYRETNLDTLDNTFDQVYRDAYDAWGAMAEEASAGHYSTPMLRAMSDAGLAAAHLIDGDEQSIGDAADAAASFAAVRGTPEWATARRAESNAQILIIRDIVGNPFRRS